MARKSKWDRFKDIKINRPHIIKDSGNISSSQAYIKSPISIIISAYESPR